MSDAIVPAPASKMTITLTNGWILRARTGHVTDIRAGITRQLQREVLQFAVSMGSHTINIAADEAQTLLTMNSIAARQSQGRNAPAEVFANMLAGDAKPEATEP